MQVTTKTASRQGGKSANDLAIEIVLIIDKLLDFKHEMSRDVENATTSSQQLEH